MQKERGFSLIELLIVVAIISLIAAIAIPNLRSARQAASSSSAVQSLRTITTAEQLYRQKYQQYATLAQLAPETTLDPHLQTGSKSNYTFDIILTVPTPADVSYHFSCTATPNDTPAEFIHYFVDDTGVIRQNLGAPATATSPPIPK